ncbi:uncharacterized protein VTP21DRAFT_7011 [Calcarisporiella thermophila]|uniref:uncharacterized protein n=1 Tax=Calcarisporiella thermophila TaxID=911321 RepID=UPI003742B064
MTQLGILQVCAAWNRMPISSFVLEFATGKVLPKRCMIMALESFPMTSNGKIDKAKLKETLHQTPKSRQLPINDKQKLVISLMSSILNIDAEMIDLNSSFFALGGDSISAIALVSAFRRNGLYLTVPQLFKATTPARLASIAQEKSEKPAYSSEAVVGNITLAPIQHMFFERTGLDHYNQSYLGFIFGFSQHIEFDLYKKTIVSIIKHHDMLRASYSKGKDGTWRQTVLETDAFAINAHHISCSSEDELKEQVKQLASTFDIERGLVHCAVLFEIGYKQRVCFIAHPLVVDRHSLNIILEDLEESLQGGEAYKTKMTAFREWVSWQENQATLFDPKEWERHLSSIGTAFIPKGNDQSKHQVSSHKINASASNLLGKAIEVYRTSAHELILCALLLSYSEVTGQTMLPLNIEGNGRKLSGSYHDFSRTVGQFTTIFPTTLSTASTHPQETIIKNVKSLLRTIPNGGVSYGALKYPASSTESTKAIKEHSASPIYFKAYENILTLNNASASFISNEQSNSPDGETSSHLNIEYAFDTNGCLDLIFSFNHASFDANILDQWGSKWVRAMEGFIEHCCDPNTSGDIATCDFSLLTDPSLAREFEMVHLPSLQLKPRDVEDIYPATPLQTSFISALARNPRSYMVPSIYDIVGEFDALRVKKAWAKVAAANSILRTVFVSTTEGVFQIVLRSAPDVPVETVEWNVDEFDKLQNDFVLADSRRGFSLNDIKFTRFTVARFKGRDHYRLFMTMHHSIIDGSSVPLLLNDVLSAYSGGEIVYRPSFKTHVESILSINEDEVKSYWKSVLDGATVPDNLNSLNEDADLENADTDYKIYKLKVQVDQFLHHCKTFGITVSNYLRAVWAIVLRHFTRCDDVIFGCIINGRDGDINDSTRIIGALINTIPIRTVLNDKMTIIDLAQAMQDYQISSAPYSQVSLSDIKHWTGLPWTQEMFPTIFSYQYFKKAEEESDISKFGFKISETEDAVALMDHYTTSEYPLALSINALDPPSGYITASALFNTDKIGPKMVDRMVYKFHEILQLTLSSSLQEMSTLLKLNELTSMDESTLSKISFGKDAPLVYRCLHHGFESYAKRQPDVIAVEDSNGEIITYSELNSCANALAHALRKHGVAPGKTVGLVIRRSKEMLVGILGILKAGVVVTMKANSSSLPINVDRRILLIDDYIKSKLEDIIKPEDLSSSDDPAYVVYTSGTTGKPKGVPIHHGGAVNCIQDLIGRLNSEPGTLQAQFMAVGFDGAISEIFSCFTSGGTLLLRSDDDLLGSLNKVQSLIITPTGLQHIEPKDVPNLQVVTLVGEPVSRALAEKWLPHVRLFNGYGPTETKLGASIQELESGKKIGVGRPFNNMSYYVLDHNLKKVPMGIVGELYIAGVGVSKGYINRPNLTEERFIENPFMPGKTMYKTGDMVRWNRDGNLEIIGRTDDQVKLNGYRIELDEVASVINAHPGVELGIALVKNNTLIGFVSPATVDTEMLRDSLFNVLPEYMVPANIFALEGIPMTINGKIDKTKLEELVHRAQNLDLPLTDIQTFVINCFASILNIDANSISLHTSFFALGGDSISAVALVSALSKHGFDLTLPQVFRALTPARLAAIMQMRQTNPIQVSKNVVQSDTDFKRLIINLMAAVLKVDTNQIDYDTSFFALGGDSVSARSLISAFRKHGLPITLKQLFKSPTPASLIAELSSSSETITNPLANHMSISDNQYAPLKPIRILCLHGSVMNGDIMRLKMATLENVLNSSVTFHYIDACFNSTSPLTQEVRKFYDGSLLTWLSTNPPQGTHLRRAIHHVLSYFTINGRVDGLLGFSEGSCIVELLDRMAESGEIQRQWDLSIHISGALLNLIPENDFLPARLANAKTCPRISIPSVHCLSPKDGNYQCNLDIRERYDPELSHSLEHDLGHTIPQSFKTAHRIGSLILEAAKKCQKF